MYIKEEDFVIVKYSNLDGFLGILAGFFFSLQLMLYTYICVIETKFTTICLLGYGCFGTYKHFDEYVS